jgi:pyruvate dehydrogenase E1 component alpha subunit
LLTAKKQHAASSKAIHLTLPETSFKMHDAESPSLEIETNKEEMLEMYTQMNIIRRIEMVSDGLYKSKKIRGFCHLSTGEVRRQTYHVVKL